MRNSILVVLLFVVHASFAQELNCKVTVNLEQINSADKITLKADMERSFAAFMNSRKWTNDVFKNYEKINCSIFINVNQMPSIGNFVASAQVVVARPVYDSNYETVLMNFADREFEFEYIESQPLEYNDNTYINNLTSMLAFYAYTILAVDYDSFSEMGGTPYVQKMLTVINNAQSSSHPGWVSLGSNRSRYALLDNMNNPQMADMRKNSYKYHRLGLDMYNKNPEQAREQILDVLRNVKKVWGIYPTSVQIASFFDAKSNELTNIFTDANLNAKREAYDLLTALDPKRTVYQKIIAN
jgi:hypothetical protein